MQILYFIVDADTNQEAQQKRIQHSYNSSQNNLKPILKKKHMAFSTKPHIKLSMPFDFLFFFVVVAKTD